MNKKDEHQEDKKKQPKKKKKKRKRKKKRKKKKPKESKKKKRKKKQPKKKKKKRKRKKGKQAGKTGSNRKLPFIILFAVMLIVSGVIYFIFIYDTEITENGEDITVEGELQFVSENAKGIAFANSEFFEKDFNKYTLTRSNNRFGLDDHYLIEVIEPNEVNNVILFTHSELEFFNFQKDKREYGIIINTNKDTNQFRENINNLENVEVNEERNNQEETYYEILREEPSPENYLYKLENYIMITNSHEVAQESINSDTSPEKLIEQYNKISKDNEAGFIFDSSINAINNATFDYDYVKTQYNVNSNENKIISNVTINTDSMAQAEEVFGIIQERIMEREDNTAINLLEILSDTTINVDDQSVVLNTTISEENFGNLVDAYLTDQSVIYYEGGEEVNVHNFGIAERIVIIHNDQFIEESDSYDETVLDVSEIEDGEQFMVGGETETGEQFIIRSFIKGESMY